MRGKGIWICGLLLCFAAAAVLLWRGVGYRITVESGKDLLVECPARARAGETVSVRTCCVTDASLEMTVRGGTDVTHVEEDLFTFTMPEGDVSISVRGDSTGYPGA